MEGDKRVPVDHMRAPQPSSGPRGAAERGGSGSVASRIYSPLPTHDVSTARALSSASRHSDVIDVRSSSVMSRRSNHDGESLDVTMKSSSVSLHARDVISRQSMKEDRFETEATSPADSAPMLDGGLETIATLGSEVDLTSVADMVVGIHPALRGAESPDEMWPGVECDDSLMSDQRCAEELSEEEYNSVADGKDQSPLCWTVITVM